MTRSRQQACPYRKRERGRVPAAYDPVLCCAVLLLLGLGMIMVASSSVSIASVYHDTALYYFYRQTVSLLIGLGLGLICLSIPTHWWQQVSFPLLIIAVLLLLAVFIPGVGREVNGSLRWIDLGPISFQASEPVKFCVIVYLAAYMVRQGEAVRSTFTGFVIPNMVIGLIALLLLLQPDLGACVVLFATTLGMLFIGGAPFLRLICWFGVMVSVVCSLIVFSPYRLQRLISFMDPWQDPWGSGFQLTQALIAFGRGEWFGLGVGYGVQKLFYLPEAHTDFVFAVLAEELGLCGSLLVILLFVLVIARAFVIANTAYLAGRLFSAGCAYGIGLLIGIQAFTNIAVNMGLLPTKGLTLPLMSYGGSSLMLCCVLLAMLLRVDYENRHPHRVRAEPGGFAMPKPTEGVRHGV